MEIKKLNRNYISQITNSWNSNFPSEFAVTENIIEDKIFNDEDLFDEGSFMLLSSGSLKGIIVAKINKGELQEYNDCGWISTLLINRDIQNNGWGTKLLNLSETALKNKCINKILLGGDFNNFFSGIPGPIPNKLSFFRNRGYTLNNENHYDLMADVSKIDFEKLDIKMNNSEKFNTIEFSEEYLEKLVEFFDCTFPGRWKFEIMNYISNGENLKDILVMLHENKIIGFCKIFKTDNKNESVIFYGKNHGSLGPIGINDEFRGKGVGNRILNDSLKILQKRDTRNVLIDWTILKDFYGQFGFEPFRTYRGGYKNI